MIEPVNLKNNFRRFVSRPLFPCIIAKALLKRGFIRHESLSLGGEAHETATTMSLVLGEFVENYRQDENKLSSCIFSFKNHWNSFKSYEDFFWNLLTKLRLVDDKKNVYDSRVSSDPLSSKFSFSVGGEAFFLILLHPKSPRFARRFSHPTIVFNPHRQFEKLRRTGKFERIKSIIRKRDRKIQASNESLADYGESSEILQYSGRKYNSPEEIPYLYKYYLRRSS